MKNKHKRIYVDQQLITVNNTASIRIQHTMWYNILTSSDKHKSNFFQHEFTMYLYNIYCGKTVKMLNSLIVFSIEEKSSEI